MRYDFIPMPKRPPLRFPDGARLAIVITPNLEYWDRTLDTTDVRHPGGPTLIANPPPGNVYDNGNWTWREYGQRVGVWRIFDTLDAAGVPASCSMNAKLALERPEIAHAVVERGWEIIAHNYDNTEMLSDYAFDREQERVHIRRTLDSLAEIVGKRAKGWLSSAFRCTLNTADILAEEGLIYQTDYLNDDQPYAIRTPSGRPFVSIPYHVETNDIRLFYTYGKAVDDVLTVYREQFDELYREGAFSGRVMSLGVHPYIMGQPSRIRALRDFITYAQGFASVWWTTREELAAWYIDEHPSAFEDGV